jgi:phospholipase C
MKESRNHFCGISMFMLLAGVLSIVNLKCQTVPARFEHIIVIVQENRTPDNLFYALCQPPWNEPCASAPTNAGFGDTRYNIQTGEWKDKTSPSGWSVPTAQPLASSFTDDHDNGGWLTECDLNAQGICQMDGAALAICTGDCPPRSALTYVDGATGMLDPYLTLATSYGWANWMFQTNQGPSGPAHQFIFSGTAAPSALADSYGVYEVGNGDGGTDGNGCIAPAGVTTSLIFPSAAILRMLGFQPVVYPCFEHQTVPDVLPAGTTWRYYTPAAGDMWTAPTMIQHICQSSGPGGNCTGPLWTQNVDLVPADVLSDIAACKLRNVSWVIPTIQDSDHPRGNLGLGPSWVASIVNQVGENPTCPNGDTYWDSTAILVTWDDWGGFYEHALPEIETGYPGDYQRGFRVPLLFISAYTRPGFISQNIQDFGSIIRLIEANFGATRGALGFADSRIVTDFSMFYHFSSDPRPFVEIPARMTRREFRDRIIKLEPPDED